MTLSEACDRIVDLTAQLRDERALAASLEADLHWARVVRGASGT
jgi:hypothetical protein